jgi:hypothetical protein
MNRNPEGDLWMDAYSNPQKDLVLATRALILDADPRLGECIRWQAPTFIYKGNIASFFPRARAHVSLMFHKGASIPGNFPSLKGDGPDGRSLKISDAGDLAAMRDEVQAIFRAWCDMRDA